MKNIKFPCPHCFEEVEFAFVGQVDTSRPAPNGQISPLSSVALRDVWESLLMWNPGARVVTDNLHAAYLSIAQREGRKNPLTKYAFVMALQQYGCSRWRNSQTRGYTLPDPLPDEPIGMSSRAKERRDAELLRQPFAPRPEPVVGDDPLAPWTRQN